MVGLKVMTPSGSCGAAARRRCSRRRSARSSSCRATKLEPGRCGLDVGDGAGDGARELLGGGGASPACQRPTDLLPRGGERSAAEKARPEPALADARSAARVVRTASGVVGGTLLNSRCSSASQFAT